MKVKELPLGELHPYENNPRFNADAVEKVAASIKEFGFLVPIVVDKNNVIAAGHTRYEAAKMLGMEKVPCVVEDSLNEKQIRAFRLADNKVAEIASWDFAKLQTELNELSDQFNFQDFGFTSFSQDFSTEQEEESGSADGMDDSEEDYYRITYEIVFENEDQQAEWYRFISAIKKKWPNVDTIASRILCATREWMKEG